MLLVGVKENCYWYTNKGENNETCSYILLHMFLQSWKISINKDTSLSLAVTCDIDNKYLMYYSMKRMLLYWWIQALRLVWENVVISSYNEWKDRTIGRTQNSLFSSPQQTHLHAERTIWLCCMELNNELPYHTLL